MKKLLATLALVMGFASVSQAGIMFEPYIGYEMGKLKDAFGGSFDGTQAGLRLAYSAPLLFWGGLDAAMSLSGTMKNDSAGNSEGAKRTTVYGVVGVDFPILVRAWAGYAFMDEVKLDQSGTYKGGSGTKLGVGFTGLPFLSINLEYLNEKFTKFNETTLGTDLKNDTYILSVSLPL